MIFIDFYGSINWIIKILEVLFMILEFSLISNVETAVLKEVFIHLFPRVLCYFQNFPCLKWFDRFPKQLTIVDKRGI